MKTVKDAWIKYEGVWPEGYTALIVSTESNSVHGGGYWDNCVPPARHREIPAWQWVCTKEEFEQFDAQIHKNAPEGAERYSDDPFANYLKKSKGKFFFNHPPYGWKPYFDKGRGLLDWHEAIPLKPKAEKWIPEGGEECEARWGEKEKWYKVVLCRKFCFVCTGKEWHRKEISDLHELEFRPLKTEAEREHDRLHTELMKIFKANEGLKNEVIADSIIEAGWSPENE